MNNPFDNQSDANQHEASEVNLMQQSEQSTPEPDFSNDSVVPGVASAGGKKKLIALLGVVIVLVLGGLGYFLLASDEGSPSTLEVPMAAPVSPLTLPTDAPPTSSPTPAPAPLAPPTGPLTDVAPAPSPCEQRMIDHATQNGADPKVYVAQNQAYLEQCKQAMAAGAQ